MRFAPLKVPLERRLQTASVFYYIFLFLIAPLPCMVAPLYLILFTPFWWLALAYLAWMYYDRHTPERGGRPSESFRNQRVWQYFARYFPIKLVKTAELPADRNYILGSHPHGILSIGNFVSFCSNATGFPDIFPGIQRSAVTLPSMFYFPFRREMVLQSGAIASSAASIEWVLKANPNGGRLISIVLGGAEEALDSHVNNFDLNLLKRKGFVRLALKHGVSLVPAYSFGETALYRQISNHRGSKLRDFQVAFKKRLGFTPPIFMGRGIFNYSFGVLPFRQPIHTVVGAPIHVPRVEDPTAEQINSVHAKYCDALVQLFDDHKCRYGLGKEIKLNIY